MVRRGGEAVDGKRAKVRGVCRLRQINRYKDKAAVPKNVSVFLDGFVFGLTVLQREVCC